MTMGERIRQARLEAGLSQRQLAGEMMTRNMLSALEHDGANPSVHTLKYLSERLCKPIGYFLGEGEIGFPELAQIERARILYEEGEYESCLREISQITQPAFGPEGKLLEALSLLELAEQARRDGKLPYSRELLHRCRNVVKSCPYLRDELERRWHIAMALGAVGPERIAMTEKIPVQEEVLLLRAEAALEQGQYEQAEHYLECSRNRTQSQWKYIRAEVYFRQQDYQSALGYYHGAEREMPEKTIPKLEICYREVGDYKMAYVYAKKGK